MRFSPLPLLGRSLIRCAAALCMRYWRIINGACDALVLLIWA